MYRNPDEIGFKFYANKNDITEYNMYSCDLLNIYLIGKSLSSFFHTFDRQTISFSQNKLNHIFGRPQHNFNKLLQSFHGNQNKALNAIYREAMKQIVKENLKDGIYDSVTNPIVINLKNEIIYIGGRITNGIFEIGTAYVE